MTTDNNEPRTIEELLRLDTYQGMSDAEIDMIIEREKNIAYSNGNRDAINSQAYINVQKHSDICLSIANRCMDMVKSLENEKRELFGEVNS
jgi:hypothetical protein